MDRVVTMGFRELVHESNPGHARVQVFVGWEGTARGMSGVLTIRQDEWRQWQRDVEADELGVAAYCGILDPLELPAREEEPMVSVFETLGSGDREFLPQLSAQLREMAGLAERGLSVDDLLRGMADAVDRARE